MTLCFIGVPDRFTMLTLTFAGDESGDTSFSFGKGATRYLVVAMIATSDADALCQMLAKLRHESGLPADFEFRFNGLSSAPLRSRVFRALSQASFEGWAIIVDKSNLPDPYHLLSGLDLYLYFVTELIKEIPFNLRQNATLILDQFGGAEQQKSQLRRVLALRNIERGFKHILVRRSSGEPLIQVADLVAGAVMRRDAKNDGEAYSIIAHKMKRLVEYQG